MVAFPLVRPTAAGNGAPPNVEGFTPVPDEVLGRHYDLLKAYLMIVNPGKVEPAFLVDKLRDYWIAPAPSGQEEVALRQLEFYAGQAARPDAPHPQIDTDLVLRAQSKLVTYPPEDRLYKRLVSEVNSTSPPVSLLSIAGAREGDVLVGGYSVPGAFTLDGHRKMRVLLKSAAEGRVGTDDWVLGASIEMNYDIEQLAAEFDRDYVDHWLRFLRGVKVRGFDTKESSVKTLLVLSGGNSPLGRVLGEVVRQTNFSAPASGGLFDRIKNLIAGETEGGNPNQIEKEFLPLIQFTGGDKVATRMDRYRSILSQVAHRLEASDMSPPEMQRRSDQTT